MKPKSPKKILDHKQTRGDGRVQAGCIRGRVVKATDLKSVGVSPRRFEPCRMRQITVVHSKSLQFLLFERRRTFPGFSDSVLFLRATVCVECLRLRSNCAERFF